jgi:hypothetical protein
VIGRASTAALALVAMLGALLPAGAAGDVRVRAYVEPAGRIVDTEPVILTISVEGSDVPDVSVRELPRLVNLKVINGPNKSTSSSFEMQGMQIRRSSSVSLRYTLLADGPGPAEIPPIAVHLGSEVRQTEAIRLQVERGMTGPASGGGRAPRPVRPEEGRGGGGPAAVFLKAEAGTSEVWLRQAVPLTVTLYAAGTDIRGFSWMGFPSFSNFWVEEVPTDANAERYQADVGGRNYNAFPVLRRILVPTSPGEATIDSFGAQLQVRRTSGDPLEDFFMGGGSAMLVRKTDPIRLRVRPLPEAGKPADFSGAVGSFKLRATLDRAEAQVNDAVALKVTVEGDGSLQSATPPRLDSPPDLKVFEPKITDSVSTSGGKLRSVRTLEWVLVPLAPGDVRIPAVRFPYFDPAAGGYREARGEPMLLAVRRSDRPTEGPVARGAVEAQRRDLAFIKPLRGKLSVDRPGLDRGGWFVTLLVLPLVLAPVLIGVGRYRSRLSQDRGLLRAKRAKGLARKRLKAAEHRMGGGDTAAFHEAVARALVEHVADRLDRPPAGLTYDVADEMLAAKGVDVALRRRFRACLETCDFARFVPESGTEARKAEILKEAREIVDLLESAL